MNELENSRHTANLIATGDPEAIEKFVRDHYASVYRSMRHLTRNREDAEDLTQQAFIVARSKIESFKGRSQLKTWIHRIAFNEYAQWKRRKRPTMPLPADQAQTDPAFEAFVVGQSLLEALALLPDKHREAIVLFEIEGLAVEEVAEITRVPTGTVKARLFYARRRLRTLLGEAAEIKVNEPKEATI